MAIKSKTEEDDPMPDNTTKATEYNARVYCKNCGMGKLFKAPMFSVSLKAVTTATEVCPNCTCTTIVLYE